MTDPAVVVVPAMEGSYGAEVLSEIRAVTRQFNRWLIRRASACDHRLIRQPMARRTATKSPPTQPAPKEI